MIDEDAERARLKMLLATRRYSIGTQGMPIASLADVTGIPAGRIEIYFRQDPEVEQVAPDRPGYFVLGDLALGMDGSRAPRVSDDRAGHPG